MAKFLYLCNGEKCKNKNLSCGECKHTSDPAYAKNQNTVKLVSEFLETFDSLIDDEDVYWEKDS